MAAAATLVDAAPTGGVTNANYWTRKSEALLWPVMNVLLLLPQRQAPDRDDNRPL